ncbi:hypothetical protein M2399_002589 [Pseudomonas sp. BIGb0450]|uniref:hypothetical protein n=1 Tax=unclassified Pseudomonas TaxID=196821 RepID=UPI00216750AB|nr:MULTISPECIES: hypothetical protein [unclassified Pseudomonas]MCS3417141.1 hypothetical protein [Pseudomonas sp. BIGb0558]MCS3437152.1 hypothetical protein [Pseudomonas sp. BIGb0450]
MIRLSLLTIAIFASMSANAAYQLRYPLEEKLGGSLPDNSLTWVGDTNGGTVGGGGTGGGDDGSTIDPTPEEPESPEAKPERKLIATLNFTPLYGQGEPNLLTENNLNVFVIQTSTFAIKGALNHNQNYYITNNGNECKYIADVCTMNVNCVYSRSGLSGAYTMLSVSQSEAAACFDFEIRNFDKKYLKNVTIYDNPKTE